MLPIETTHEFPNEKEVGCVLLGNKFSPSYLISLSSHDWSCIHSSQVYENLFVPESTTA